jgi:hypothetical protein
MGFLYGSKLLVDIVNFFSFVSRLEEWEKAIIDKGHIPVRGGDNDLDIFVTDSPYHNGPGCSMCGWTFCWHCFSIEDIPECGVKK